MNLADVAPEPTMTLGMLGCSALACLLIISTIALVIVLVRRNRKDTSSGA
jgi:putative exporter of polyketide antibiotics